MRHRRMARFGAVLGAAALIAVGLFVTHPAEAATGFKIRNATTGKCINVRGGGEDVLAVQDPCDVSQRWLKKTLTFDTVLLTNVTGTQCLNVFRGSGADTAFVVRSTCNAGLRSFQWRVNPSRGGDQYIAVHSNKPMVVQGDSRNDGAFILQDGRASTTSRWFLDV